MARHLHVRRSTSVVALVVAAVFVGPAPAHAAAPGNDVYSGRTTITAVPHSEVVTTGEATTDPLDGEVNAGCGAPATDASVWFSYTATVDQGLVANVRGSDYPAGVIVATGGPGAFTLLACGPGATGWQGTAGTTYTILAFDDQSDGGVNGGTLRLDVDVAPPPPTVALTVNSRARFTKIGSAIVTGTVKCSGQADFAFLETELRQAVGRVIISGSGGSGITCDGLTRPWSAEVVSNNGTFAGGKAASLTFSLACGAFECGVDFVERSVQLSGVKR